VRHALPASISNAFPVAKTALSFRDLLGEWALRLSRRPLRTILTASSTVLGVATALSAVGFTQSAQAAVIKNFNAQQPTQVVFQQSPGTPTQIISERAQSAIQRLPGVLSAGVIETVQSFQPFNVSTSPSGATGSTAQLPITAASPAALTATESHLKYGRLYDTGFERHREMVTILGASAAAQLHIQWINGRNSVFVNGIPLVVLGVIDHMSYESQALLGLIVPPYVAHVLSNAVSSPTIFARTQLGAAAMVAREGPTVLSPNAPSEITAQVPPDSALLESSVTRSISQLLQLLALVMFVIGVFTISNVTLLSVIQRYREIGLRRALGARTVQIYALIQGEAMAIGLVGGLVGTSLGIVSSAISDYFEHWSPVLSWEAVLLAPAVGVVAGLVAGIYPALRAVKISPIRALQGD
jgi:putative ABC transport system permease protein